MLKIVLPKNLDQMSKRENKAYAQALSRLSQAIRTNDNKTAKTILTKFKLGMQQ